MLKKHTTDFVFMGIGNTISAENGVAPDYYVVDTNGDLYFAQGDNDQLIGNLFNSIGTDEIRIFISMLDVNINNQYRSGYFANKK